MGAQDNILDDGGTAATGTATPSPAAPSFDPAVVTKAVTDALAGVDAKLDQHTRVVQQTVQQTLQQAQQHTRQGTATKDEEDLTQQLLSGGEAARKAITAVVQATMADTLGPYLSRQVQTNYESNIDSQRTSFDAKWGPGAFDKFIKEDVEQVVANTTNASARGDKAYIQSLVRQSTGNPDVLDKLEAHRTEWQKKLADDSKDDDVSTGILGPGRRRPKAESLITDDDRRYMDEVAQLTGTDIDMKAIEEVMKVKAKHGFIDTQLMPGMKNKLQIKGDAHKKKGVAA